MWVSLLYVLVLHVALGSSQGGRQAPAGGGGQVDPCTVKAGVAGDATYCDRYWECVLDVPQLYDCPNGLVFVGKNRGIAEGCDYPWRGNYCGGKKIANPPIQTDHCGALYGIFGHETSCTRYWTCWNGTATEQFCIGGLLYHEGSHSCDWPENVAGCQKHPICQENPFDNVPLGTSCQRYWACQGGYPRLQRCSANLFFDKTSKRCTEELPVGCEPPAPPAPRVAFEDKELFQPAEKNRGRKQASRRPSVTVGVQHQPRANQQPTRAPRPQQVRGSQQQPRPRPQQQQQQVVDRPQQTFRPQPQQQEQLVEETLSPEDQQFLDQIDAGGFEEQLAPQDQQTFEEQPLPQQPRELEVQPLQGHGPIRPGSGRAQQTSPARPQPFNNGQTPLRQQVSLRSGGRSGGRSRTPPIRGAIQLRSS